MRRTWSAHHHLAWRMRIYFHHCYCSWTAVVVAVGDVHPGHRVMAASAAYYAVMVHQEAFHVLPLGYWGHRVASSFAEAWHSCQSSSCTWKGNGMTLECVIIDLQASQTHLLISSSCRCMAISSGSVLNPYRPPYGPGRCGDCVGGGGPTP